MDHWDTIASLVGSVGLGVVLVIWITRWLVPKFLDQLDERSKNNADARKEFLTANETARSEFLDALKEEREERAKEMKEFADVLRERDAHMKDVGDKCHAHQDTITQKTEAMMAQVTTALIENAKAISQNSEVIRSFKQGNANAH
jgi:ElaB/YqjD/DUF883 family membrane-anchored ribosome-binding protein